MKNLKITIMKELLKDLFYEFCLCMLAAVLGSAIIGAIFFVFFYLLGSPVATIAALIAVLVWLSYKKVTVKSSPSEEKFVRPVILARKNFKGNTVFFEMQDDGTCGYYYKWYENGKGFRSNVYTLTTKASETVQAAIKSSGCRSAQVEQFVQVLVAEYLEKNK